MKKLAWIVLVGTAAVVVLVAMAVAAYLLWGLPQDIGRITINGHPFHWPDAHGGHWALATMGLLLAALIVLIVVPTVLVLAVVVPSAVAALGVAVGAAAVGLLLSPLILLVWWLWKRSTKADTIAA